MVEDIYGWKGHVLTKSQVGDGLNILFSPPIKCLHMPGFQLGRGEKKPGEGEASIC